MSKTLKKFRKHYETDENFRSNKKRKTEFSKKQNRNLDNILKSRDVKRILDFDSNT